MAKSKVGVKKDATTKTVSSGTSTSSYKNAPGPRSQTKGGA